MNQHSFNEIVNKAYRNALKQAEDKLRELYDTELTDEDKKLISLEDFASNYTLDFTVEDKSFIQTGEIPKVELILRLKTPEEILAESDTMDEKRRIDFKVEDHNQVTMSLDDFKWLCTELYYTCNAVGCIPSTYAIDNAEKVLQIMHESNLTGYVD